MGKWYLENPAGYITLEFTNHCNLDCVMCDTGKIPLGERHHLDFDLFKKIIDDLSKSSFNAGTLVPFWLGEPLMHPRFAEMMDYAQSKLSQKGIAIELHTNATFLSPEISRVLIGRVRRVVLSIDALTQATYNRIRRGGSFERVLSNVLGFLKERQRQGMKLPMLVFQFIAMEQNLKEKQGFVDFWQNQLAQLGLKCPEVHSEGEYPSDSDCVFIRRLETSAIYSETAKFFHSYTSEQRTNLSSKMFNVIIPYFRFREKIPLEIYKNLARMPKKIKSRCKNIVDFNVPTVELSNKFLAELITKDTWLNIGFSSNKNFDNVLEIFERLKYLYPLVNNIIVFEGDPLPFLKSPFVDEAICLKTFSWYCLEKWLSLEYAKPKEGLKKCGSALNKSALSELFFSPRPFGLFPFFDNIISYLKEQNKKIICINPLNFISSWWNRFGPSIWSGDRKYSEGLSSVFGVDYGHFSYEFECPFSNPKGLEIYAKVCSHSHILGKKPEACSDLTLEINGKEIETRAVFFEPNLTPFVEHWEFKIKNLKRRNTLTFRVKPGARHKRGLTIYVNPLNTKHSQFALPIVLAFEK